MSNASGQISNNRSSPVRMVALCVLLCCASSGFMLFLSSGTLAELARRIHLSAYRRVGERLQLSVERGLRFGRPLSGYAGLREQVDNARAMADGLNGLAIADAAGNVIAASGHGDWMARDSALDGDDGWREQGENLLYSLPLIGREGRQEGTIILAADPDRIRREQGRFWRVSLAVLAGLTVVVALGLSGWAAAGALTDDRLSRKRYRLCLLFAGGGQVVFCVSLMWLFSNALAEAETAKISVTARTVVWDVERLLAKGVRLEQVYGLQTHLEKLVRENPEILALRMREGGRETARSGSVPSGPPVESRSINRYWPDAYTPWRESARLEVWMNPAGVRDALWLVGKNLVTALLVSLLLLNELARFLTQGGLAMPAGADADCTEPLSGAVRMLAFVFFIAYDMSMSFVPLYAASLPARIGWLPPGMIAALPLTLEAALVGAGMLLAGRPHFGTGFRARLRVGVAAALLGSACSWLAGDVAAFCAARSVAGLGFGMFLMTSQLVLLDGGGRAKRLGELYSGVLSGSLCGLAGGAMAAELLGFGRIFLVSAMAFIPALLMTGLVGPGFETAVNSAPQSSRSVVQTGVGEGRRRFFLSFSFLGQVLLVAFPAALTLAGLVFYSLPILLERLGAVQGDIGRVLMIHGLCVVVAGPVFGKRADAGRKYTFWVAVGGALTALALFFAWLWPSLPGLALATAACGLGYSALNASGMARITGLAASHGVEAGPAGGVYRFVERLGQMLGPLVFGMLIGGCGFAVLCPVVLAGAVAFAVASRPVPVRAGEG